MAQTTLDTAPASPYAVLVTLTYGASPTIVRLARWTSDLVLGDGTFTAAPELEVELGQQHGGTEDKPHKIRMKANREPLATMALGFRFASVQVVIEHLDPRDATTRRHLGQGRITQITKNPTGRVGLIQALVGTIKIMLDQVHVGIQANTTCDNEFGNSPYSMCQLDVSSWVQSGTVATVQTPDRNVIGLTLPSVSDPVAELPNLRFRRGYIEIDGLRLLIKRSLENKSFELFSIPGPFLVGKTCTVHPGCGGKLSDCRLWNNEEHFNGIGIKIPARNPVFEQPSA